MRPEETRADVLGLAERSARHAEETVAALPLDAPGHVPWWSRPEVSLFAVMVHVLDDTLRHAGHADILREQTGREHGGEPGAVRDG
ncbi:DUF664 domain-containing protein [Nocardioides convexus]|uniref:mycothiol transferase n=1 Tax=Nocardioides convexus TaxID=2712224 RepID=UPI0024184D63|nr:DUF664 domain-containing protein [Nocardioides convexus]